jgi:cation diffusion facilitator CzcD-associated flavoprotein CzcO
MRDVAGHDAPDQVGDGWTRLLGGLHRVERRLKADKVDPARIALEVEQADVEIMEGVRRRIRSSVKDAATAQSLLPYYRLMCKRPGFHDQYLDSFNRDNVTLVDTAGAGVEHITPTGVVATGQEYEIDCLVFATGFDVGRGYIRSSGIDVTGVGGTDLAQTWASGMRTLHGFLANRFPNCFFMGATQSAISPNFTHSLLVQADHISYITSTLLKNGHTRVEATPEAQQQWCEIIDSFVTPEYLEFQRQCIPSYFNNEGKAGDPNALQAGRYPDFEGFVALLEEWRSAGMFDGLDVT